MCYVTVLTLKVFESQSRSQDRSRGGVSISVLTSASRRISSMSPPLGSKFAGIDIVGDKVWPSPVGKYTRCTIQWHRHIVAQVMLLVGRKHVNWCYVLIPSLSMPRSEFTGPRRSSTLCPVLDKDDRVFDPMLMEASESGLMMSLLGLRWWVYLYTWSPWGRPFQL